MNEEGDKPNASQAVQSTSMDSLNDELASKTDEPQQDLKHNEKSSLPTKVVEHVRALLPNPKEKKDLKLKVSQLEKQSEAKGAEFDQYKVKCESEKKEMETEIKSNANEMEKIKAEYESNMKYLMNKMSEMETGNKLTADMIQKLKSELEAKGAEVDKYKMECESEKKSLMNKMSEVETRSKLTSDVNEQLKSRISELENEAISMKNDGHLKATQMTIRVIFTGISKIEEGKKVYSAPTSIAGINWKVTVSKDHGNMIYFYLEGEMNDAVDRICPVITEFRLVNQKTNEIDHIESRNMIYDEGNIRGLLHPITLENLFDEEKGYVKADSIIVDLVLTAYPRRIQEGTVIAIRARFAISKSKYISVRLFEKVYSEPTKFDGVTWNIDARNDGDYDIVLYLKGEKINAVKWICPVITELRLLNQKTQEIVHIRTMIAIYDETNNRNFCGHIERHLLKDEKEYVKDDSIIVDVLIKTFPIY